MPSEHRLHPASLLFAFARSVKQFALPGLLFLVTAGRGSSGGPPIPFGRWRGGGFENDGTWQLWLMVLLLPAAIVAVARYLSFRLRYEGTELVVRSGILFRNERHVPYDRIQNLDATQNVFHRLLGVVEVRVETGGSKEPEATISVLPMSAFHEMRQRVFAGRVPGGEAPAAIPVPDVSQPAIETQTLLHLPFRELLLLGLLENRGMVLVAAGYGLLWELGLFNVLWNRLLGVSSYAPGMVRATLTAIARGESLPLAQLAVVLAGIAVLLVVVRLVSMAWATIRLYGFRLGRVGEDLRSEFGLFTRVTTTIPLRRIQTLTIREGLLQRLAQRVSVRVATAGGGKTEPGEKSTRELIAPIIRRSDVPALVQQVMPGLDLRAIEWQPVHPRAFRRYVKKALVPVGLLALLMIGPFRWWGLRLGAPPMIGVLTVAFIWAVFSARQYIRRLGWSVSDDVVVLRSGWLWRSITAARVVKIQAVTRVESPFDRRAAMARVRVDTASGSELSHRVDIPYLAREIAEGLHHRLSLQAAHTAFRW